MEKLQRNIFENIAVLRIIMPFLVNDVRIPITFVFQI